MPLLTPDDDKQIDLDPSEWSRDKPIHQRVLTPEGRIFLKQFAILFIVGMVLAVPVNILVRGKAPYWIDDYITFQWEGMTPGQALAFGGAFVIVPLALDRLLALLRYFRG